MNEKIVLITNHDEIISKIYTVRGQKVILDRDIAALYGVETRRLNEQVKRNITRFPSDFMLQLHQEEWDVLKSQIAILKTSRGQHSKYLPCAFTEQGVAMLSSVLNSERAIEVNIQIMRTFIRLKKHLSNNEIIQERFEKIEKKLIIHDLSFDRVFEAIERMLDQPKKAVKNIGFIKEEKE